MPSPSLLGYQVQMWAWTTRRQNTHSDENKINLWEENQYITEPNDMVNVQERDFTWILLTEKAADCHGCPSQRRRQGSPVEMTPCVSQILIMSLKHTPYIFHVMTISESTEPARHKVRVLRAP